jgi:large subunit ribosomal protein L15
MKLNELKPSKGLKKKGKRIGRGLGSGKGTYSTRGMKGQKARSGSKRKPGFEGGRTRLISQIPKTRGFKSRHERPEIVNILDLEKKFKDGDKIGKKELLEVNLISNPESKVKILGQGKINKKLKIEADLFSKSAEEKIKKAGGEILKVKTIKKEKKDKNK